MYRLLLVDNERAVLDALVHALDWAELGFERIDLADDGTTAWDMLRAAHYDVVISDIRMPRMDGLELLRLISSTAANTRTIMLTAFDEFDYVLRALRLGASNYLMKPIDPSELRASVISALNSLPVSVPSSVDQPALEEYTLRRWLVDGPECRDLDTRAALTDINIFLRSYNVLLLHGEDLSGSVLPDRIRLLLGTVCEVWMLHDRPDEYVYAVGGKSADGAVLCDALDSIRPELAQKNAVLVIGKGTSSYLGVSDVYRECLLTAQSLPAAPAERIFCAADSAAKPLPGEPKADSKENISPLVRRAVQIIRQQYAQPLSLGLIAQQLGTNANYLGFVFRQETGEYFSEYLNSIRIQEAQRLLRDTDQTVGAIAAAVGYSSVNYFCQVFKKATLLSPARYREQK